MERKTTGGAKQFSYTKEDLARIRGKDTEATKRFKEAYQEWQAQRKEERTLEKELEQKRKRLTVSIILLVALLVFVLVLRLMG
jgi:hypothetical protein